MNAVLLLLWEVRGPLNGGAPIGSRRRAEKAADGSDWAVPRGLSKSLVQSWSRSFADGDAPRDENVIAWQISVSRQLRRIFGLHSAVSCGRVNADTFLEALESGKGSYVFFAASPLRRRRRRRRRPPTVRSAPGTFPTRTFGSCLWPFSTMWMPARPIRRWQTGTGREDCVSASAHVVHMGIASIFRQGRCSILHYL